MRGKDADGKFAKGNKFGSIPRNKVDPGLLTLMSVAMPSSKRLKILKKAVEQAIEGDKAAREWLFNYVYGKAPDTVDLNVSGGLTWDVIKGRLNDAEEVIND